MTMRKSEKKRTTAETSIRVSVDLDGVGESKIETGVGFFDHMLTLFAKHGGFDLAVKCKGDLAVDGHHSIEDVGIVLGEAVKEALGDKAGIARYGSFYIPMDEALAFVAVDISGRPYLVYEGGEMAPTVGDYDTDESILQETAKNEGWTKEKYLSAIRGIKQELLGKSNEKAFLAYQWGVWVTAHSRDALERGIRLVHETDGADFIYCDTDSVKYVGSVDWSSYNNDRIAECLDSGSYAVDPSGVTHYMGVFETEDLKDTGYAYRYFKTLGAKKYAYIEREGGKVHCTIAGVNKKKGGAELDKHGGLSAFEPGFVFTEAGGTQAVYNDAPEIDHVVIEGKRLPITANVAILPSEYTLGITGEYERILKYSKNYLYNPHVV